MQRIYDGRSKYVHAGLAPEAGAYDRVQRISREVAFCLFRLQRDEENRKAGFQKRWLRDINLVAATVEAQRDVNPDDWVRIGIGTQADARYTEFEAELKSPLTTEWKKDRSASSASPQAI